MKVLTYGDIMDGGVSVFTSVAKVDLNKLVISFSGDIRIDNPYKHLSGYLDELDGLLQKEALNEIEFDFRELRFCNSNGFYIIMDITELIYEAIHGPVLVKRLKDDDWQQETLPILLNVDEEEIYHRTSFEEHAAL